MTIEPSTLWDGEAAWAAQEWGAIHEPKRRELLHAQGSGINSSTYYISIGEHAKRTFEIVADQLLHRVRSRLATRNSATHIGTPQSSAAILIGPLVKLALQGIPNGKQVAASRGFMASNLLEGPLDLARSGLKQAARTLEATLAREFEIRLEQLDSSDQATKRRLESDVLGDFVRLGTTALDDGHKDVAAVLAAAALEDCLKRLAFRHDLDVEGKTMQDIVGALKGKRLVRGSQKSMLETMPKLRDYAMHAEWNKIDAASVRGMLGFVDQFLIEHFS